MPSAGCEAITLRRLLGGKRHVERRGKALVNRHGNRGVES